jgi:hypothetical protein
MPNFSKKAVVILKAWLKDHIENPYPGSKEKESLSKLSGLTVKQV